ncbi:MAG: hypothetical protein JWO46_1797 [Nocardioidaceae bacterium]|nr:hypothetical protein [Nocardioidaceae bacterium]
MTPTDPDSAGTVIYREAVPFGEQPPPIEMEPEDPDVLATALAASQNPPATADAEEG